MIALAPVSRSSTPRPPSGNQDRFLEMLPLIRRIARFCFRRLPRDQREDAVEEVLANAFCAYVRLVERGKADIAYATPLARYAVAQYRAGRRVGNRINIHELTSPQCQQRNDAVVESLFRQTDDGQWEELVVEDKQSTPAVIASTRLDFRAWLRRLDRPKRTAAKLLAGGATTTDAALRLKLSQSRISQLRRELQENWQEFQGETAELAAA